MQHERIYDDYFRINKYSEVTIIYIDSILYSPDFNKLAILVIAQNPTNLRIENPKFYWEYNATCYLAVRQHDSLSLNWIGPILNYWNDKHVSSCLIGHEFFNEYVIKSSHSYDEYYLNYNFFWNSEIWTKQEEKKRRRKFIDEIRKYHPENVYEPNIYWK